MRLILATTVLALIGLVSTAKAEPPASQVERYFKGSEISQFTISLDDDSLKKIGKNPREYVPATVRDQNREYRRVGMHLKGAAGSYRDFNSKPALTLNFDKFNDGQRFHGMDKLHLNNSIQDPSYLTEIICGEMFLKAGVPTARGTHALVNLQGKDRGLYVLKEGYDHAFLQRHFKNPDGNLYDGEFLRDIDQKLKKSSGSGDDRADLQALVAACRESDPAKRKAKIEKLLDVDRFISLAALENLIWHWDGYCMKSNNYRIYHDPSTKKMTFIPHGMDQMFWEPEGPITAPAGGLVARAVFGIPEFRKRYYARVAELRKTVFVPDEIDHRIDELVERIIPVLESVNKDLPRQFEQNAKQLKAQIRKRAESVDKQLAARAAAGK